MCRVKVCYWCEHIVRFPIEWDATPMYGGVWHRIDKYIVVACSVKENYKTYVPNS